MNNVYTLQNNATQRCYTEYTNRDGFTGGGGGGCTPPLALARGVLFFMIKQKRQNEIQ